MRFSANLLIAHAFTLIQAALEVEIQKKISSQQRLHLNQDLKLAAEVLVSGSTIAKAAALFETWPGTHVPPFQLCTTTTETELIFTFNP